MSNLRCASSVNLSGCCDIDCSVATAHTSLVVCVFGEVGGVSESSSAAPPRCPCAQWQAGQSIKPKALMHAPGSLEVEPLLVRPKAGRLTLNSVPTALSPRSSSPAKNSKSIRPIFFPVTMLSASRPEIANITVTRIIVMTMRNGPDSGTNVLAAGTQFATVSSTDSLFGATGASMQSFMVLSNPCVHIRPRCDAGSTLPYSIRLVLLQYRRIDIQLFQKRSIAILSLYCHFTVTRRLQLYLRAAGIFKKYQRLLNLVLCTCMPRVCTYCSSTTYTRHTRTHTHCCSTRVHCTHS